MQKQLLPKRHHPMRKMRQKLYDYPFCFSPHTLTSIPDPIPSLQYLPINKKAKTYKILQNNIRLLRYNQIRYRRYSNSSHKLPTTFKHNSKHFPFLLRYSLYARPKYKLPYKLFQKCNVLIPILLYRKQNIHGIFTSFTIIHSSIHFLFITKIHILQKNPNNFHPTILNLHSLPLDSQHIMWTPIFQDNRP